MGRRPSTKNQALADQVVAILRNADGFPMSTGDIAHELGDHLHSWPQLRRPIAPRPPCWPDDLVDPEDARRAWCSRCRQVHRQPIWRNYDAGDIRGLLNRLAKAGEVEKLTMEGVHKHYWRREDTDR